MLQGLNPNLITLFTVDNIDFLHSHARVFCGNQNLRISATMGQHSGLSKPSLHSTPTTLLHSLTPPSSRALVQSTNPIHTPQTCCADHPCKKNSTVEQEQAKRRFVFSDCLPDYSWPLGVRIGTCEWHPSSQRQLTSQHLITRSIKN